MNSPVSKSSPIAGEQLQAVSLTPAAIKQVSRKIKQRGQGVGVRLSIKQAGCSGYKYVLDYVDEVNADDYVFVQDDKVTLYVDKKSYAFIKGTVIDYVKEQLGSVFKYNNPNEAASCGCGESFAVTEDSMLT